MTPYLCVLYQQIEVFHIADANLKVFCFYQLLIGCPITYHLSSGTLPPGTFTLSFQFEAVILELYYMSLEDVAKI